MTAHLPAAPTVPETDSPPQTPSACAFCKRRLGDEYFFACRRCGATYCYIHSSRHSPQRCTTVVGGRPASPPARRLTRRDERALVAHGVAAGSSANV